MNNCNSQSGATTLEMLISFSLLVLCLSAVIMVALTNQTIGVDIQTNGQALGLAQKQLEQARNKADNDFNSVGDQASVEDIYQKSLA
ncbi:MAG: hypothetical protein ACM3KM_01325, partial [Acidobacteriaceae bacterium]